MMHSQKRSWLPGALLRFWRSLVAVLDSSPSHRDAGAGLLWRFTSLRLDWLLLSCILALGLRLIRLSDPVWYDEAFTASISKLPILDIVRATVGDVHPPAYYLVIAGYRQLVSLILPMLQIDDVVLRLPSIVFGLLTVIETYHLAGRFDNRLARWSALAAAILPAQINYSQESRSYQLLAWLILLAARGVMDRRWLLVTVASSLAMYTHNLAALYLVIIGIWSLFVERKSAIRAWFAASITYLPWLIGLTQQLHDVDSGFWVQIPAFGDLVYTSMYITIYDRIWPVLIPSVIVATSTFSTIVVLIMARDRHYWPILSLAVVPSLLMFMVSRLWTPIYIYRIAFPSSSFIIILALAAIKRLAKPERLALASMVVPVLAASIGGYYIYNDDYDYDWRIPTQIIRENWQDGDQVWHVTIPSYILIEHYLPGVNSVMPFASDLSQSLTQETKIVMRIRESSLDDLQADRLWIMYADTPLTSDIEKLAITDALTHYQVVDRWLLLDRMLVKVELYLCE
jgi:hypothetical protein